MTSTINGKAHFSQSVKFFTSQDFVDHHNSQNFESMNKKFESEGLFVQYGCGFIAPDGWINFDASPTLRLQRIPIAGKLFARLRTSFPKSVRYGDVVKGLPIKTGSCDGVYASHVLEHLALEDFNKALVETRRILRDGGRFRLIVPDLHRIALEYLEAVDVCDVEASHKFMRSSYLGVASRPKRLRDTLISGLRNSDHLWMWDKLSMKAALAKAGFQKIRPANFGDSEQSAFDLVEDASRFDQGIAFEAVK